jgi:hypothetical protein
VVVTNTSAVDQVTIDTVEDNRFPNVSCPETTLAPGQSFSCQYLQFVSGEAGLIQTNVVTVSGSDNDGNPVSESASADVVIEDVQSPISLLLTADPPSGVPEPGGPVTFSVTVTNLSLVETVTITELTDLIYGDLNGQGDCAVQQQISPSPSGVYTCRFTATIGGNAGDKRLERVTVVAEDNDGNAASANDSVIIEINDELPAIELSSTANPNPVAEPGGPVTFTVTVANLSVADAVTIDALSDSIHGDLIGQGRCNPPPNIAIGGSYRCSYSGDVTGTEGETVTNTVSVEASDDDGNSQQATAETEVVIGANPVYQLYLPTILKPQPALLYIINKTGGAITFSMLGAGVSCPIPDNPGTETFCDSFPAGTYRVRAVTDCGTGESTKTYLPGKNVTTVSCN